MTLILPGVEISVVKEIVTGQLNPAGILGLIGVAEDAKNGKARPKARASSYKAFRDLFGPSVDFTVPEAKQAFQNGISEICMVPLDTTATFATAILKDQTGADLIELKARARGSWANKISVTVENSPGPEDTVRTKLKLEWEDKVEIYADLEMNPDSEKYIIDVINSNSSMVTARLLSAVPASSEHAAPQYVRVEFKGTLSGGRNADEGVEATAAQLKILDVDGNEVFLVKAKNEGEAGNKLKVNYGSGSKPGLFWLKVQEGKNTKLNLSDLSLDPSSENYVVNAVNSEPTSPVTIEVLGTGPRKIESSATGTVPRAGIPAEIKGATLSGGTSPVLKEYEIALEELEMEPDVDLVCASVMDFSDIAFVKQLYATVEAHCKTMSLATMNRIGFGQVPPPDDLKHQNEEAKDIVNMTLTLSSDRFVLVAPYGVLGAVIGLIGSLKYYESPTYKTISGVSGLRRNYSVSNLKEMLKANVLLLEAKRGKGIIVEKGIATSGEQISVTRIADRAVRGVKMIGDAFIGTLNTHLGRNALKEKITEFFLQMEKDGAIQPN
ncbi:MAG: hypothetical protein QW728_03925, partial [Thermoplasmata archaeon]